MLRLRSLELISLMCLFCSFWPISTSAVQSKLSPCRHTLGPSVTAAVLPGSVAGPRRRVDTDVDAVLTFIRRYGLLWTEADLFGKGGENAAAEMSNRVSEGVRKTIAPLFDMLKARTLSIAQFHERLYFADDPMEKVFLPLAFREETRSKNDHHFPTKPKNLAGILSQMPKFLTNGPFGTGLTAWLPGLFKVAEIRAEDTKSPARHRAELDPGKIVSVVLWTGGELFLMGEIGSMDVQGPRLVITGRVDGNAIEVFTVEVQIFDGATWTPYLYEHRDGRLKKVFQTADRIHSIQRCVSCHGSVDNFSPIPFKTRRKFEPAPGWFNRISANSPVEKKFGSWSIKGGAGNTYNSIKEYTFDWSHRQPSEVDLREIHARLSNLEEVKVRYSDVPAGAAKWTVIWREDNSNLFHSPGGRERTNALIRDLKFAARDSVDHGIIMAVVDDGEIISEAYTQAGSDMTSLEGATARLKNRIEGRSPIHLRRLHFRAANRPAVLTPEEFLTEERLAKSWSQATPQYSLVLFFNNPEGKTVGVSIEDQ